MAKEAMLSKLPIPPGHVHRIEAERPDRDAAARDYQAVIARVFGVDPAGPPPAFDLILLGMGPDGHTASLFPGTAALDEKTRWVVVNHVPKFAADRLTMTLPILNRAREVLFLVDGGDKAERLAEVLEGMPDPRRLPAQAVRPTDGRLLWYVDRAAGARIVGMIAGEETA
jgi:6-phosphogluconolactonase